ncbi:hypothetical protein M885DRAFT_618180 [Pelagophyceae sp. CCMP2097]|nr:hypothetical protein M885DRAFT_618180 [Pelagophyceae sp. CCMP2097]
MEFHGKLNGPELRGAKVAVPLPLLGPRDTSANRQLDTAPHKWSWQRGGEDEFRYVKVRSNWVAQNDARAALSKHKMDARTAFLAAQCVGAVVHALETSTAISDMLRLPLATGRRLADGEACLLCRAACEALRQQVDATTLDCAADMSGSLHTVLFDLLPTIARVLGEVTFLAEKLQVSVDAFFSDKAESFVRAEDARRFEFDAAEAALQAAAFQKYREARIAAGFEDDETSCGESTVGAPAPSDAGAPSAAPAPAPDGATVAEALAGAASEFNALEANALEANALERLSRAAAPSDDLARRLGVSSEPPPPGLDVAAAEALSSCLAAVAAVVDADVHGRASVAVNAAFASLLILRDVVERRAHPKVGGVIRASERIRKAQLKNPHKYFHETFKDDLSDPEPEPPPRRDFAQVQRATAKPVDKPVDPGKPADPLLNKGRAPPPRRKAKASALWGEHAVDT